MEKDNTRKENNNHRIEAIKREFEAGFEFINRYELSVTIFGSSHFHGENKHLSPYYEHARKLGERIVKDLGYAVLTGGGPGIMEGANKGAFEAGGKSLGLTIDIPHKQETNKYLTDHINFYYFFSRKVCLSFSAEAYVFYPGGFGTLDEFFEILTLVQTGKISSVPIILVGEKYWKNFNSLAKKTLLKRFHTVNKNDLSLYTITDDLDQIVEIIRKAPKREENLPICPI